MTDFDTPNRPNGTAAKASQDPVVEAFKKDIDRTLLRQNLRRSVGERLENFLRIQKFFLALRGAARRTK